MENNKIKKKAVFVSLEEFRKVERLALELRKQHIDYFMEELIGLAMDLPLNTFLEYVDKHYDSVRIGKKGYRRVVIPLEQSILEDIDFMGDYLIRKKTETEIIRILILIGLDVKKGLSF